MQKYLLAMTTIAGVALGAAAVQANTVFCGHGIGRVQAATGATPIVVLKVLWALVQPEPMAPGGMRIDIVQASGVRQTFYIFGFGTIMLDDLVSQPDPNLKPEACPK
jgi:hypothetical protein